MLIKICGMKEPGNVKEVAALHPDMLGFIFIKPHRVMPVICLPGLWNVYLQLSGK